MRKISFWLLFGLGLVLAACSVDTALLPVQTLTETPTLTPLPPTQTATFTTTATSTITPTASATPFSQPAGCLRPIDDYTLVTVNGVTLNQRTYGMLAQAATLYSGKIDLTGISITQGSYTNTVDASFGTHAGGGAVDISVMEPGTWTIQRDDFPALISALRQAGFAAYVRELDELYSGSPIHIHAIAVGDRDLSPAAHEQLYGEFGYFNGYDGLPENYGGPNFDRYGGPVICEWMVQDGFAAPRAGE
jgi:hypothetical protein